MSTLQLWQEVWFSSFDTRDTAVGEPGAIHAHYYLKIARRTEKRIQLCAKLINNAMHYFPEILIG